MITECSTMHMKVLLKASMQLAYLILATVGVVCVGVHKNETKP